MKTKMIMAACLLLGALPLIGLAQEPAPSPSGDVLKDVGSIIDAVRSGKGIAIAAAIIMLLTNLFKLPWLGGLVKKIPSRWRIAIPILLSGVAGILAKITMGMPWGESLMIGLFSGPMAVFAHEAVVEAILGRSSSRGVS